MTGGRGADTRAARFCITSTECKLRRDFLADVASARLSANSTEDQSATAASTARGARDEGRTVVWPLSRAALSSTMKS